MTRNRNLSDAKKNKHDEFYTKMEDIEKELVHYESYFSGKVVYCNCDDPRRSNFYKYFKNNFRRLGLKKLIATCYMTLDEDFLVESEKGLVVEYEGLEENIRQLQGTGDFRSAESIAFLKESDVVVTNPPFSKYREFLPLVLRNGKKLLTVGNYNVVTYAEVFPYIQENELWLGVNNKEMEFKVPNYYPPKKTRYREDGENKWRSLGNICWFTNIEVERKTLLTDQKYTEEDYPKYANSDAIEVSKVVNIPKDYNGLMGVPVTFLDKYNPNQFRIIDRLNNPVMKDGKSKYKRILIKRKLEKE